MCTFFISAQPINTGYGKIARGASLVWYAKYIIIFGKHLQLVLHNSNKLYNFNIINLFNSFQFDLGIQDSQKGSCRCLVFVKCNTDDTKEDQLSICIYKFDIDTLLILWYRYDICNYLLKGLCPYLEFANTDKWKYRFGLCNYPLVR